MANGGNYKARISITTPPLSPCDRWMHDVLSRSQAAAARLEALENLARHCRDHRAFQAIRPIIDHEMDDLSVRKAIVRALALWEDGFFPAMAVVHALSVPGLRQVAVETLDAMSPVSGQKETRLLAELANQPSGAARQFRMAVMPGLYGRDHRFLNYLRETLRSGNRWERAMAASVLCGIGEIEPALEAAADPEARVRKSVAAAIGGFHEERGLPVLERLLGDPDAEVVYQAAESLRRLGRSAPQVADGFDWMALLRELSEYRSADAGVRAASPGWLGESGATETQIAALEQRIGRALPPSYRAFLAASNGFHHPSSFIQKIFGVEQVEWFREHNAGWAEAYRETYPLLGSCLQVSAVGDAAVVLLNPAVVDAEGEWQTYFFANWIPGARPYPSFRAFMQSELDGMCEWKGV
ncbi:MAG TPA: HEAT repeat domain-containing protein [Bryobacteraceae bacterium]|nr:HEAT repeat domain-containing protein [Bryobacteraceae bacterium]